MSDRTCTVPDCDRPHSCKGLCVMHYKRMLATGTTDKRPTVIRYCTVDGCQRGVAARELCGMHYGRLRLTGTTDRSPRSLVPPPDLGPRVCVVVDCQSPAGAGRFCSRHQNLMWRTGDIKITKVVKVAACAAPNCHARANTRGLCESHYVTLRTTGKLATIAECMMCGAEYQKRGQALSCGDPVCLHAVRRATARESEARRRYRKDVSGEIFDPHEVYDRDGWICGICEEPIDRELRYPDRHSVSLDHIIPLVLDGPHTRANTQPAHLACNFRKGARIKPPT